MIVIDSRDKRAIYEQVVDRLSDLMLIGALEPGDKLPSVRSLAVDLSINPNTIQKAYQELERQGIIYMKRGQGTFINPNIKAKNREEKMEQLKEEIKKIIVESMYLGITKDEFIDIISTSYEDTQNI